jgi:ACS family D-galactonate transporter-like MFS transporter
MTVPADHPNASGIPHRRWMIALLLGFGVLVNYFDRVNLSVAKGALHAQFGLSTVAFGYMLAPIAGPMPCCNYPRVYCWTVSA